MIIPAVGRMTIPATDPTDHPPLPCPTAPCAKMPHLTCVPTRPGAAPPLPCPGGRHRLDIDDSSYRPLGARRAVGIAHSEYGRVLADNTERGLPGRLRLRCPDARVER